MIYTTIILAGGKATRMQGQDKGLLVVNGETIVQRIIRVVEPSSSRIMIITGNEAYRQYTPYLYPDLIPYLGPIGGLYTGLAKSDTEWNFVVSCDLPLLSEKVLLFLFSQIAEGDQAIVPIIRNMHRPHPLCAFYHKGIIKQIENQIQQKNYKMKDLLKQIHTKQIIFEEEAEAFFTNVNTPEELEKIRSKYGNN